MIPCRTTLEVIIPSRDGLSPEQWKDTATLCPLDWPSNYSLLRLWHIHGSLQKTENNLRSQTGHSHMFTSWTVHHHLFAERVLFRRPPVFEAATVLQRPSSQWRISKSAPSTTTPGACTGGTSSRTCPAAPTCGGLPTNPSR